MYRSISLAVIAFGAFTGVCAAQVPPDIAAELEKIGRVVELPNTMKLYTPMFANQKEPYPGVTVVRDVAIGSDPLQKLDVVTTGPAPANRPVLVHVHGGGFERGDKVMPGSPFYDNIMLWATRNGMVGVNVNYRLAPKNVYPAAHEDLAAAIRWVKANIAQYGGNPNHIVLLGQSAGASLIAGYLSHPEFHPAGGHGIAAAVLHSGVYEAGVSNYFGDDPAQLRARSSTDAMKTITIPVLVTYTEVDLPVCKPQAEGLRKSMCDAGHCPLFLEIADHSHISQTLSYGTPDTSVSGPVLTFVQSVK